MYGAFSISLNDWFLFQILVSRAVHSFYFYILSLCIFFINKKNTWKKRGKIVCLGRRQQGHEGKSSGGKRIGKAGKPRLVDNSYFDTLNED